VVASRRAALAASLRTHFLSVLAAASQSHRINFIAHRSNRP